MSTNVNPPLFANIPQDVSPQLRVFLRQQQEVLRQLYNKTGGQGDPIDDATTQINQVVNDVSTLDDTITSFQDDQTSINSTLSSAIQDNADSALLNAQNIDALDTRIDSLEGGQLALSEINTATTLTGNQIVICTNSVAMDVTLNGSALNGEQAIIKSTNADVNIIGTVDGNNAIVLTANQVLRIIRSGSSWYQI